MHKLTDKEAKFCNAMAQGYTQYESYIMAYDPQTNNRASIDVMASRLAKKEYIQEKIHSLVNAQETALGLELANDKNKRITLIWDRINACLSKNDENNVVKYIDMLNKLAGDYKNINVNENDVKPLSTMSNEDLNKLIASIEN